MTLEAILGEDGGDILGEIDGGLSGKSREARHGEGGRKDLHTNSMDERCW
jgi:hypothetical protein